MFTTNSSHGLNSGGADVRFFLIQEVSGQINENIYIEPGHCKKGSQLISGDFASCCCVIALLKNKQLVMYHARSPSTTSKNYQAFIELIVNETDQIFIFDKNRHRPANQKSFGEMLSEAIPHDANCKNISIIPVENYQVAIVVTDDENKVSINLVLDQKYKSFNIGSQCETKLNFSGDINEIGIDGHMMQSLSYK